MKFLLFFCACVLSTLGVAQSWEIDEIKCRNIGPAGMSGRFTSIAVDSKGVIYAGAASGGVWKSEDGGLAWKPIFDSMPIQSIGALAVHPANDDVIWVGTGEGNPRNSHNSGAGIYKSMDAGRTWKFMGLAATKNIHRIILDPRNEDKIMVGALGVAWGNSADRGVYVSKDAGATWEKKLYVNENTGCAELVIDPNNANKLIASMWEFGRKPYTFKSGGKGSGLYISTDGGETWTATKTGLPTTELGRIGLAIAPSNTKVVYALVESAKTGLYKSENGGYSWQLVSTDNAIGNRPFYYAEIYCNPSNENHVISLWSQITHSIDGGKHWEVLASWNHIHPDHHALWIDPKNPKYMINGSDGGINISHDGGANWRQVDNLPVGQFYYVATDNAVPYNVYGGLQDNGSWKGPGYSFSYGGLRSSQWQELLYGDGFGVHPLNQWEGYAMSQGGNLHYYNVKENYRIFIQPVQETPEQLRFNWNAPLVVSQNDLFYGSQYVHYSNNKGQTWKVVSPDLTTNDTAKLHQAQSGGLTIDATNAENYCTITALAKAENDNLLCAGTDDGNVWLCQPTETDYGLDYNHWVRQKIAGLPNNAYIQKVIIRDNYVWVVANNYRQNDWKPYLFESNNKGKSWKSLITETIKGHCLSFVADQMNRNLYFLGTDCGLYISLDAGKTWKIYANLPKCPVQDLQINQQHADLIIGTFGRSIWIIDDLETLRNLEQGNRDSLSILGVQKGFLNQYTMPAGERFANDDRFKGTNKDPRTTVTFRYNGNATQAQVRVITADNKLTRNFTIKTLKKGINSVHWAGESNGVRWPSYAKNKIDKDNPPAGAVYRPAGNCLFIIKAGNQSDTAFLSYQNTLPYLQPFSAQVQALNDTLESYIEKAFVAFEDLKNAKEKLNEFKNASYKNDSLSAIVNAACKKQLGMLDTLQLLFTLPPWFTQYEVITPRLNNSLGNAYYHIQQCLPNTPLQGSNAALAVAYAGTHLQAVLSQISTYYLNNWRSIPFNLWQTWQQRNEPFGGY